MLDDIKYEVDTEHVNGEGYINHTAINDRTVEIMSWVYMISFILIGLFIGWMIAVAIGGF